MPSSWICVDASLVVGLVSNPERARLRDLWTGWLDRGLRLTAPSLLRYEVTNTIFQYQRQDYISPATAERLLRSATALPIQLVDDFDLSREALSLARRFSLKATYDAHYLALAERLDALLWTTDRRLAKSVESELDRVRLAV